MTAEPAPSVAAAPIDLPPTEAAAQVLSLLRSARSKVPAELLTAHLTRLYGDTTFPIHRAAAEATHRRLQIAAEEKLRVVRRPRTTWRGDYQTARAGRQQRPYTTRLLDLEPLLARCDCPDFRGGLTVQPRADGGMVLQADRESAAVLADVLRGLAGAIEVAVGSRV